MPQQLITGNEISANVSLGGTSGNVGIGVTPSGTYKLQVTGNIGNDGTFSNTSSAGGEITKSVGATTASTYHRTTNTGGSTIFGSESSAGASIMVGSSAYSGVVNVTGAYPLGFGTNNTERMRIDSSGNVGIGTSSPATKLHVVGGETRGVGTGFFYSGYRADGTTRQFYLGGSDSNFYINVDQAVPMIFSTSNTERMRIDSSGNVGIGTSSPSNRLEVVSPINTTAYLKVSTTGTGTTYLGLTAGGATNELSTNNAGDFVITSAGVAGDVFKMVHAGAVTSTMVLTGGNVGIGTTSPVSTSKLTVNGSISVNGADTNFGAGGQRGFIDYTTNVVRVGAVSGGVATGTALAFNVGNVGGSGFEAARIDPSGNLGLGVTPSAWGSAFKAFENLGGALYTNSNSAILLSQNSYYDGTNNIYKSTNLASVYTQNTGRHIWYNAPSGTAGTAISLTTAMILDASGNLGIGTSSPATTLDVSVPAASMQVSSTTGTNRVFSRVVNTGGNFYFGIDSSTGGLFGNGNYARNIYSDNAYPMVFSTNSSERMRIDSSGTFIVGATASTGNSERTYFFTSVAGYLSRFTNSSTNPYGIYELYSGATPNNTGNEFIRFDDNAGTRFNVRSNGGISNYSANNVNLSDRREKTNFAPSKAYLDIICNIPVQTFNYIDQNREQDDGLTLGVVAQDVQAVAPEMVTESNWGSEEEPKMRLSIYQTDLQYALMKSIQELKAINDTQAETINALTARIVALETK